MTTAKDIDKFVKKYSLHQALGEIGKLSFQLFNGGTPFKNMPIEIEGRLYEQTTAQWALAFLAFRLIECSNDFRSLKMTYRETMQACGLFSELHEPFLDDEQILPMIMRVSFEQFAYQERIPQSFARHYQLLIRTPQLLKEESLLQVPALFHEIFGLPIDAYIFIGFAIGAMCKTNPYFNLRNLHGHHVDGLRGLINQETVEKFVSMSAADYAKIRATAASVNKLTIAGYERYQFNPLFRYPLVKADARFPPARDKSYIVPNIALLTAKTTTGVYWALRDYFLSKNNNKFTSEFGRLFEHYVGRLLKEAFGEENVFPEIEYQKGKKTIDWFVQQDDTLLLIECKASLLKLIARQTYSEGIVEDWLHKVVVKGIEQLCITEQLILNHHPRLELFKKTAHVIKVIILYENLYFTGTKLFAASVEQLLKSTKVIDEYPDALNTHVMKVGEFELLEHVLKKIPALQLFERKQDYDMDFIDYVRTAYNFPLENTLLELTWKEFFQNQLAGAYT